MHYFDEYIDASWGKVCVVRAGHVGKPLVLLHGLVDNAGGLQTLTNILQPQNQVYIIELPGCGYSDPYPPGLPVHLDILSEVVRIVVDHYKLDVFDFIGHSLGVQIGLHFNALHPGRMLRIVALDSILYPPVEPINYIKWYNFYLKDYFNPEKYKKRTSALENGPMYTYNEAMALIMKAREIPEDASRLILNRALRRVGNTDKFRFNWDQRMKNIITPTFTIQFQLDFFGNIQLPHFIILSKKTISKNLKTHLMNPYVLKAFYSNNPNFRLVMVDGSHDVHLSNSAVVAQYVSKFLTNDTSFKDETVETLANMVKAKANASVKSKV